LVQLQGQFLLIFIQLCIIVTMVLCKQTQSTLAWCYLQTDTFVCQQ